MISQDAFEGVTNQMRRVDIINVETYGFDVGIGVGIHTMQLMAEGNSIQGLTYGVQTYYDDIPGMDPPIVDFGGGSLGSAGSNIFSDQPKYAYYHETGTYYVPACFNDWQVAYSQIHPLRIYDKLDDPQLGTIFIKCLSQPGEPPAEDFQSSTPEGDLLTAIPEQDANCRDGNNILFDIADTLRQGEEYSPMGRGRDNLWLLFAGPSFGDPCWVYFESLRVLLNGEEVSIEDLPESLLPFVLYPQAPTPTFTPLPEEEPEATPIPSPQCDDGTDNDGDGQIDLVDRECRNASDNDEANP